MTKTMLDRRRFLAGLAVAGAATATPLWARRPRPFFEAIGKPLGVQLYALGPAAQQDLRGTLSRLKAMGYSDFELPGLYGRSAQALRADADAAGVTFGSIHLPMTRPLAGGPVTLMSDAQEIADTLGTLGIRRVVLPGPPIPEGVAIPVGASRRQVLIDSVGTGGSDYWKRLGALLNTQAAVLRPHGIGLGYHNHNMEFRPVQGTTGWKMLLDELDRRLVFLELDLAWVAAGGLDPVDTLHRLKERVRMVHLKDIGPATKTNYVLQQDPMEVGLGSLDWRSILKACAQVGVQRYYVEQEAPFTRDRFESMKLSHDYLASVPA